MPAISPRRPPFARAVTAAAALLLGLAGCADDSAGPPSEQDTTVATGAPGRPLERYEGYRSVNYDDPSHWVCRPEADDICKSNLDATVIEADGTMTVEPFRPAENPPLDCFYLYPTISRDTSTNSDWSASPEEEGWVTLNQAARLRSTCRVFAPVYRQMTLQALTSRLGTPAQTANGTIQDSYDDVLDAFRTYMAQDNAGRPFVLIGHSQGADRLQRLVHEEIDPNADVRERLTVAFLAGWPLAVPADADVGSAFEHVPLCRERDQTGCVFSWSTYRKTAPPPAGAFFGRLRFGGEGIAACNTPVNLHDGAPAALHGYLPANPQATILAAGGTPAGSTGWVDAGTGEVTTPFVSLPGLVSGTCTETGGVHHLSISIDGDPADPRADDIGGDLSPEWGLHLQDVNLVMGDIVSWVQNQADRLR